MTEITVPGPLIAPVVSLALPYQGLGRPAIFF